MIEEKPTLCYYLAGIYKPTKISLDKKTDRIETHTLLFGGTFFTTGQTVFFPEPRRENKKQKFVTRNPGNTMDVSGFVFLLPVGSPHPFKSMTRVDRVVGDAA